MLPAPFFTEFPHDLGDDGAGWRRDASFPSTTWLRHHRPDAGPGHPLERRRSAASPRPGRGLHDRDDRLSELAR